MSVGKKIVQPNGLFFITFTCARWVPLFQLTDGYDSVYKWFDYLKQQGHYIAGYVIMPSHIHVLIAFSRSQRSINTIIANGKRFMAYALIHQLKTQGNTVLLNKLASWVTTRDRLKHKLHQVFEPSFDWKECRALWFAKQKADYIHRNPCKAGLADLPENYLHSSARYYITGVHSVYPVITYMELQDIDLG